MDREIFTLLFKSRVRPILEYGNTIWSPGLKRDIDAIERVQRRATKTVAGMTPIVEPAFSSLQKSKRRYDRDGQIPAQCVRHRDRVALTGDESSD